MKPPLDIYKHMKINIPNKLKEQMFCRIRYKTKKPFELAWNNKPYTYEQILPFLETEQYGVLTGINNLGVLDDDTKDKKLLKLFYKEFGKTFRVRDHLYIYIKGITNKIIFEDVKGEHLGELQWKGQQAVGPGSVHPSGEIYELKEDIPIKEVDIELFEYVFSNYIKKEKPKKDYVPLEKYEGNDFIKKLQSAVSMESVLSHFGVNTSLNPTNCIFHNSKGNKCLSFNFETAHCFNCNGSWNIFSFVKDAKKYDFVEALEWLSDFAGMAEEYKRQKEEYFNKLKVPMGWANSINIKRMAERHGLLNCPNCKIPFGFNEKLGFYRCSSCGIYGGLKRFAELIVQKQQVMIKNEI